MKLMKTLMTLALALMFVFIGAQDADAYTDWAHDFSDYGEDFANCTGCHNDSESAMMPAIGFDEGEVCASCHSDSGTDGDDNATNGDGAIEVAPSGHGDSYGQNCADCHTDQNAAAGHGTDDCASCHEGAGTYDPTAKSHSDHITDDNIADCLGCHNTATETPEAPDLTDCLGCHSQSGTDGDDNATVGDGVPEPAPPGHGNDMGQNCAQCHENQMADAGHATNDCATCHQGAGTYDPDAGGGSSAPPMELEDSSAHMNGFANNVGADNAEGGSCEDCHSVHGSEDGEFLTEDSNNDGKYDPNETCLKCHGDELAPGAPALPDGHPSTEGKECASCHNIHGGYTEEDLQQECISCHVGYSQDTHYGDDCTSCHGEIVEPQ